MRIAARRSRSARICFSIESWMEVGGSMAFSSTRLTRMPHLPVASSSTPRRAALISSREVRVRSRSMPPMMFRRVVTEQYPKQKEPTAPRFHGRHQLNRWPDGLEKCIGCELCAWACPADAIYVEGASNVDATDPDGESGRFSPGERYGRVYQINYLRCILCGLCIEACPTRALTMTNEYELADNNRADLIYEKSDLLAPLLPGMEQPPHPMRLGDDEGDYYRGTTR